MKNKMFKKKVGRFRILFLSDDILFSFEFQMLKQTKSCSPDFGDILRSRILLPDLKMVCFCIKIKLKLEAKANASSIKPHCQPKFTQPLARGKLISIL